MQLQIGDVISRPGPLWTVHVGFFAGVDMLGQQWVIHNAKNDCVRWDLLETFATGLPISLVKRASGRVEGNAILTRAQAFLGRQFDLINFNCEHFVTQVLANESSSPQLRSAMVGVAFLACIGLLVGRRAA